MNELILTPRQIEIFQRLAMEANAAHAAAARSDQALRELLDVLSDALNVQIGENVSIADGKLIWS